MALTVTSAISRVRRFLSDPHGDQWTDAEVTDALTNALAVTSDQYAARGGSRFKRIVSGTATDGEYDILTALGTGSDITSVVNVQLVQGTQRFQLERLPYDERELPDNGTRTVEVSYIQRPTIGTSGSDPLVSSDGTNELGGNWGSFESLVTAEAALMLQPTDGHRVHPLLDTVQSLRNNLVIAPNVPRSRPSRGLTRSRNNPYGFLKWDYMPSTGILYLHQRAAF